MTHLTDIPLDFKIEHDRLIYELQPIAARMFEIMKSLPTPGTSLTIEYGDFDVIIIKTED